MQTYTHPKRYKTSSAINWRPEHLEHKSPCAPGTIKWRWTRDGHFRI